MLCIFEYKGGATPFDTIKLQDSTSHWQ